MPTVTMTRIIPAPAEQVFRAWTDPEIIQRWLAPQPCHVRNATTDPRPGGRYAIVVADSGDHLHSTTGEYRELIPGRRLVKTWSYDGPYGRDDTPSVLTVDFREVRPGVTELRLTHTRLRDEETKQRVSSGWMLCLDRLTAIHGGPTAGIKRRNVITYGAAGAAALALIVQSTRGQKTGTRTSMKIKLSSVYVDDQDKALKFYTEVMGFVKKRDSPMGGPRWLTVVSPDEPAGTELVLEPQNEAARIFKRALVEQGIPLTAFQVDDIQTEYNRLVKLGVAFRTKPTKAGEVTIAILDDTCGNYIQIYQV